VEPLGRKLLGRGANLQDKSVPASMDVHMITLPNGQTVPAACPGEIAGLNFGSCLNYFFVRPRPGSSAVLPLRMGGAFALLLR
jgi:hypothetical protein